MSKKVRFSRASHLAELMKRIDLYEKEYGFTERTGYAQAVGDELRMMHYGEYDALLRVVEELQP